MQSEISNKVLGPFDYIESINKGEYIDMPVDSGYSPWLSNLKFSLFADTIFYAVEANQHHMENQQSYDFYRYSVKPRNRYGKWPKKKNVTEENIKVVCEVYKYSTAKAVDALKSLTPEQIEKIKIIAYKGVFDVQGKTTE